MTAAAMPRKTPQTLAAQLNEARKALRELLEISGEAHIELNNSHAVRKLAKFIKAREKARKILESEVETRQEQ